jgi:peptide chain release factor 3
MSINKEIQRRRTFAIISHPDAGKTTLTEKFLLYGGAIQVAGAVKSNKIKKSATSDFMEIERQRGISVATSVMSFEYADTLINLLDTPGHKDFAEDTYRTLTAVDSVILVVDCVKGVEEQTEKLMQICRMRAIPVIIFINKLDRDGRDPFDLLDELEEKLSIRVRPLTWPIGMGSHFKGVYSIYHKELKLFQPGSQKKESDNILIRDLAAPELEKHLGERDANQLREDIELIEGVYDPFAKENYRLAEIAPVFFGSAINNFGVQEMLHTFIDIAPVPLHRESEERVVEPDEKGFSGFVFKIHANIDPRHRDRVAFLRVVSGEFKRNTFYKHVRLDKSVRFNNPYSFMAASKDVIEEAYPGDVIGLYDTGNFKIGDTLTDGENIHYKGIPSFSPELFMELVNADPMKSKQLDKGIRQLTDEGVAQLFVHSSGHKKVVGTVGQLQFDVIQYRLENEYGAKCRFSPIQRHKACWMTSENKKDLEEFIRLKQEFIYYDKDEQPVFMAETSWALNVAMENNTGISFHTTTEFMNKAG